jgi:hypothetical protein
MDTFQLFAKYPLRLNICNSELQITTTVIYIGEVPDGVRNQLQNFIDGKKTKLDEVNKFYGQGWVKRLGLTEISVAGGAKREEDGDSDFNFDTPADSKLSEMDINFDEIFMPKPVTEDKIKVADDKSKVDGKSKISDKKADKNSGKSKVKIVLSKYSLFPHDKISDFKLKIFAEFGILPIFQHLSWPGGVPYKFYVSDVLTNINITNILEISDRVAELPIHKYYDMKDDIRIEAYDTVTILKDIFSAGHMEFNLVNLNDFITPNLESIKSQSKNDKYIVDVIYWGFICVYWPMFTPGIFAGWLNDPSILESQFPDLCPSQQSMITRFEIEAHLTMEASEVPRAVMDKIKVSVTSAILNVNSYGSTKTRNIYIRGLFDLLELSETVDYCIAVIALDLQVVVLKKVYTQNSLLKFSDVDPHIDRNQIGSISYRIKLSDGVFIIVTFFENGNYVIRTNWREEKGYSFASILKTVSLAVNPLIVSINSTKSISKNPIPQMSIVNTKFTEVGMSVFWEDSMSDAQFRALRAVMEEFNKAGILVSKMTESGELDYYFSKGMYIFDIDRLNKALAVNNHYEYLSASMVKQKWYNVFEKTHIMSLKHRSSDVMITMTSIKEQEYETFMAYIYVMFNVYSRTKPISVNVMKHKRALVDNKEQDPEFYNIKSYASTFIYSRVCQKPYQPRILTDSEYEDLPAADKKRALRFWNFTKKVPVWYFCPQKRFPYVRFITNKHPLGNCVPCCKINPVSDNSTDPKRVIHDICMKNHVYLGDKKTVTSSSRYIMTYGKDIETDRLCRLPENTMEPLFLDLLTSVAVDQECAMGNRGYYLYGVTQHTPKVNNVGILFCLAKALNYTPDIFIEQCKKRIKDGGVQKFTAIKSPYASQEDLIKGLSSLWVATTLPQSQSAIDFHWNDIFEKIGYLYFSINIVMFIAEGMKCTLRVPGYLKSAEDLLPDSHQHLVIVKRHNIYNPVFLINTSIFFITKDIERKTFTGANELTAILSKLVRSILPSRKDIIDLNIIKHFASSRSWTIKKVFVNKQNYAFAVTLSKSIDVTIPVQKSFYSNGINSVPDACELKNLSIFMNEYNLWIADLSLSAGLIKRDVPKTAPLMKRVEPIHPYMIPEKWLEYNGNIIAFVFQNMNFYINPTQKKIALKVHDGPIIKIQYHPQKINKIIQNAMDNTESKHDDATDSTEYAEALYSYYEYQLFTLAFLDYVHHTYRNPIRKRINSIMLKSKQSDIQKKLEEYLIDSTLTLLVNKFVSHGDRKAMIKEFSERRFSFDTPNIDELIALAKNTKEYTIVSDAPIKSFPRIIGDCSDSSAYCKQKKFIVRSKRTQVLLDILLTDLQSPFKGPALLSGINDRTLSFFDFYKRSFEIINIEFRSFYKN